MSVDHHERIKGVVKAALKEACMGEPFGCAVTPPSVWPVPVAPPEREGEPPVTQNMPAWFVLVTIRAGLGEPDIGNGFPVPGVLPTDEHFRQVATQLLERNRRERDATNLAAMQAAGPSMKLSERPK